MDMFYLVGEVIAESAALAVDQAPVEMRVGCLVVSATTGKTYLSPQCEYVGNLDLHQVSRMAHSGPGGFMIKPADASII
jgi:hypothetical protein